MSFKTADKTAKTATPVIDKPPETLFAFFILIIKSVFSKKFILRMLLFGVIFLVISSLHTYLTVVLYNTVNYIPSGNKVLNNILVFNDTLKTTARTYPPGSIIMPMKNLFGTMKDSYNFSVISWILFDGIKAAMNLNNWNYAIFWYFLSSIFLSSLMRMTSVKEFARFWLDFFGQIARLFGDALSKPGGPIMFRLLFGMLLAMFLGRFFFNPLVCLVLSVSMFLSICSRENGFIFMILKLGHSDVKRILKLEKMKPFNMDNLVAIIEGLILGFLLIFTVFLFISLPTVKILFWDFQSFDVAQLFITTIIFALLYLNMVKSKSPKAIAMFVFAVVGYVLFNEFRAFADDGGWAESGQNAAGWLRNGGTPLGIKNSVPPGIYAGLNAIFGPGLAAAIKKAGGAKNLYNTLSQTQKDFVKQTASDITNPVGADNTYLGGFLNTWDGFWGGVGKDVGDIVDVGIYWKEHTGDALTNSWEYTKEHAANFGNGLVAVGGKIIDATGNALNHPLDTTVNVFVGIGNAEIAVLTHPLDTASHVGDFIWETVGGKDLIDSMDPNKPLEDRLGSYASAAAKAAAALQMGSELSGGAFGTNVVKTGAEAAGETGAKTVVEGAAKAGTKEVGETVAEGAAKAGTKEVGETVAEGAAKVGTKEVGETTAEGAAKAGTKEVGETTAEGTAKAGSKEVGETAAEGATKAGTKEVGETAAEGAAKAGTKEVGETAAEGATKAGTKEVGETAAEGAAKAGTKEVGETAAEGTAKAGTKEAGESAAESGANKAGEIPHKEHGTFEHTDVPADTSNMTKNAVSDAQKIAEENNARVSVRQTNADSLPKIESGEAVPKASYIKNKTIDANDVLLGASEKNKGLVGDFSKKPPVMPEQGAMTNEQFAKLQDRFKQRMAEIEDNATKLAELEKKGVIEIKDGVIYDVKKTNQVIDGVVHDVKTVKPFAGDYDIFSITKADGTALTGEAKKKVLDALMNENGAFRAQHGAHLDWNALTQSEKDIFNKILNGHSVGKEPLITFAPGKPPTQSFFNPNK